jgi:hypothetical protein
MNQKIFVCKKCAKEFKNRNAFGGHVSSHNRYKGMILKNRNISYYCLNCNKDITFLAQRKRPRLYCNNTCMSQYRQIQKSQDIIFGVTKQYIENYRTGHIICEICNLPERASHSNNNTTISKLAIDHNHNTGIFRGLLCSSCNRNLGWAENNLSNITKYLNK